MTEKNPLFNKDSVFNNSLLITGELCLFTLVIQELFNQYVKLQEQFEHLIQFQIWSSKMPTTSWKKVRSLSSLWNPYDLELLDTSNKMLNSWQYQTVVIFPFSLLEHLNCCINIFKNAELD